MSKYILSTILVGNLYFLLYFPFTFSSPQGNDFDEATDDADKEDLASLGNVSKTAERNDGTIAILATKVNNSQAVKAWSLANNLSRVYDPFAEISSIYSANMVVKLVKTYHDRTTTNDPINEAYYTLRRLGDNVWFNIERVVPFKTFIHWAVNTSRITDRYGPKGNSLINNYIQNESRGCAPESSFHVPFSVIMSDDANRRLKLDPEINDWFRQNENTPAERLCNRFRGLRCNPSKKKCECESQDQQYHAYHRTERDPPGKYRDGCYIKPWKSCMHLSLDTGLPAEYKSYHAHQFNMKQFLFRMATPMPRTARCEKGTYCVDMILNLKRPICWCSSRMHSKECFRINGSLPLLPQFLEVRKQFHLMMIPEQDRSTRCLLDAKLDDHLQDIQQLISDVPKNYIQIYRLMKEVLGRKGKNGKFCDFRKGLACDPFRKTCVYKSGCGPGRVSEVSNGRKTCLVNNGYPCPTIELQCVRGAECKDFGKGKHCHCVSDKYGDLCKFENPTFFGTLLQSRVCGFVGYHFINLQELVNHVLAPVERLMVLGYGKTCNVHLDPHAMNIVRYLGGIRSVTLEQMDGALGSVQHLVGQDELLCDYRKFLGCAQGTCEPLIPDVAKYELKPAPKLPGKVKVHLRMQHRARCGLTGNSSNVPAIFQDIVRVQCLPQHECRKADGRSNSMDRYCLCPNGMEGNQCEVKIARVKRIDIYESNPHTGPQEIIDLH